MKGKWGWGGVGVGVGGGLAVAANDARLAHLGCFGHRVLTFEPGL